jgi:hypothetical protein
LDSFIPFSMPVYPGAHSHQLYGARLSYNLMRVGGTVWTASDAPAVVRARPRSCTAQMRASGVGPNNTQKSWPRSSSAHCITSRHCAGFTLLGTLKTGCRRHKGWQRGGLAATVNVWLPPRATLYYDWCRHEFLCHSYSFPVCGNLAYWSPRERLWR